MEVRKKILLVCDSSKSLLDFRGKLIEELLLHNDVAVFTPRIGRQQIRNKLLSMGVSIYENELNSSNVSILSDLRYLKALYQVIKKVRPDVFFPYAFKPVIYGTLVANCCGVKKITAMLTGLGYNFSDHCARKGIVSQITRMLLKLSLRPAKNLSIIFQNKDDQEKLINTGIIGKQHRSYVVNGSGVDMQHYDYSPPELSQPSFIMISRLINAKGVSEYVEAAKIIRQSHPHIRFKLIGASEDNIDAIDQQLYQEIVNGETIEYYGSVSDVRPFIKHSSVVVLPSYYGEGVPRCLLEGMAMGRAIITTDATGCRETVNSTARNGFLIPVKDVAALVSKIKHFIVNTPDVISFGLNGRSFIAEKFDVNLVNIQMLQIILGNESGKQN